MFRYKTVSIRQGKQASEGTQISLKFRPAKRANPFKYWSIYLSPTEESC